MENYEKRNADIVESVLRWQKKGNEFSGRRLSVEAAVRKALEEGAPRFYLTREHVWKRLHERRRCLPPREKPHRRAMWEEMAAALAERQRQKPGESAWESLDYVLERVKPSSYFITEEYAMKLVKRELGARRGQRGRKGA